MSISWPADHTYLTMVAAPRPTAHHKAPRVHPATNNKSLVCRFVQEYKQPSSPKLFLRRTHAVYRRDTADDDRDDSSLSSSSTTRRVPSSTHGRVGYVSVHVPILKKNLKHVHSVQRKIRDGLPCPFCGVKTVSPIDWFEHCVAPCPETHSFQQQ